jgi:hypothetical protein
MMNDKAELIVKRRLKPKISYYINPLWIKIIVFVIILLIAGGLNLHA